MYNEKSYKRLLFMIKVKRVFFIVLIALGGSVLGGLLSSYLVDVLMFSNLSKNHIVIIFAVAFFILGEIITTGMERTVHDGYWKIATLRKLSMVSKKLDSLERIEKILTSIDNADDIAKGDIDDYEDNYSIFDKDMQKRLKEINHPTKYHYVGNENYSFFDRDTQNKLKDNNYSLFDKEPTDSSSPVEILKSENSSSESQMSIQEETNDSSNESEHIVEQDIKSDSKEQKDEFISNVENITSMITDVSNSYLESNQNDQQETASAQGSNEIQEPDEIPDEEKKSEHRYKRKNKKERIRNKKLNRKKKELSKYNQ